VIRGDYDAQPSVRADRPTALLLGTLRAARSGSGSTGTLGTMKLPSLIHPPKRQSFWLAVVAGVIAQPIIAVVLSMVYWALRPFIWSAIYMEPYRPPLGAYPPSSGEWLFTQGIGFCAAFAAGISAAYWSPPNSNWPTAVLVVICLAFLPFTQFPFETSVFRNALYALHTPLGLVLGALLLRHWQAKNERTLHDVSQNV
jgi:hypothetical protein